MVGRRLLLICIAATSHNLAVVTYQPVRMYEDFIWGDAYYLQFQASGASDDMFPLACGWWGYSGGAVGATGVVSTRIASRNAIVMQATSGMETQNIEFHFCDPVPIFEAQIYRYDESHRIVKGTLQYHDGSGWVTADSGLDGSGHWLMRNTGIMTDEARGYHNRWRIHDWESDGVSQRIDGVRLQMQTHQEIKGDWGCSTDGSSWMTADSDWSCAYMCADYNFFTKLSASASNCQCLSSCELSWSNRISYLISHEDAPAGYMHRKRSCLPGGNEIESHPAQTVLECSMHCDSLPACAAFLYGVNYAGAGSSYLTGDCYLFDNQDAEGCDGGYYNTDLFVKTKFDLKEGHTCRPGYQPITSSWEACKEAVTILRFRGDTVAHVDYNYAWGNTAPEGCHIGDNGRFHFNRGVGGGSRPKDDILCELSTTTSTTATTASSTTTMVATASSTATMLTTTATTETVTSTAPVEIVECELVIEVASPAKFAADPAVKTMLKRAAAELLEVNEDYIRNLIVTVIEERRLSFLQQLKDADPGMRRLLDVTTKGGVKINFDVVVPADGGPEEVTATILKDRFDRKSLEEASDVINQVIQSEVLGSQDYDVRIVAKKVSVEKEAPSTTASASSSEDDTLKIVIIALLSASMCTIFFTVVICWHAKSRRKNSGNIKQDVEAGWDSILFSRKHLLTPPRVISEECRESLCRSLSVLLDSTPDVIVLYSAGQREEDAQGAGPGLFFAAAAIQALHEHKVPCFCASKNEKREDAWMSDFLSHSDSSCKMLVVVETSSLYACRNCLMQIYNAITLGVTVLRLRFEEELPGESAWWPGLDDNNLVEMRGKVQAEFKLGLVMPDPPEIVQSATDFLDMFALDVVRRLASEAYVDLQVNAFSKSVEDTLKSQQLDARERKQLEELPLKTEQKSKQNAFAALKSRTRELLTSSTSMKPAKSQLSPSRARSRAHETSEEIPIQNSLSTRSGKKASKRPDSVEGNEIQPSKSMKSHGSRNSPRRPRQLEGDGSPSRSKSSPDEMQHSRSKSSPGRSDSKEKKERRTKAKSTDASDGDFGGRKRGRSLDTSSPSNSGNLNRATSEVKQEKKKATR